LELGELGELHALVEHEQAAGHEVVSGDGALRVDGELLAEVSGLGGSAEATDVPLDLAGVEAELFGELQGLWVPALDVGGEIDEDIAVLLEGVEAGHAADHLEDAIGIELGVGGVVVEEIEGDCGEVVAVDLLQAAEEESPGVAGGAACAQEKVDGEANEKEEEGCDGDEKGELAHEGLPMERRLCSMSAALPCRARSS
jgi:hypothetical protein